jgi:ribosomal protein S18 acetylase RimI-like enzyme
MSFIKLVKATEDSLQEILALRISTMTAYLKDVGWSMTEEEHVKRVKKNFDNGHMILCYKQSIGYIKFKENEKAFNIIQFQISPEHQGQGYGRLVLDEIESKAHKKGKRLSLKVLKANPAKRLYERFGFQIVDEDEFEFFMEKAV